MALPLTVTQAPWRRYFRPNEGHMVQGLAPSGCSYLAGKPVIPHRVRSCTCYAFDGYSMPSLAIPQVRSCRASSVCN